MKTTINELQALQNAANILNMKVYEKYSEDRRKTVKKYFLQNGQETVSPVLDYEQLNHFIFGWITAIKRLTKN